MLRMKMIPFSPEHQFRCLNRQLQAYWQGDTEHLFLIYIYILCSISAQFQLFQRMVGKAYGLQDMTWAYVQKTEMSLSNFTSLEHVPQTWKNQMEYFCYFQVFSAWTFGKKDAKGETPVLSIFPGP